MDVILAQQHPAGGAVVVVALIVLVLLWPLIRRVLRGLGTMFALYGMVLLVVALAGDGRGGLGHAAGLLLGGLAFRAVGGIRYGRRSRRLTDTSVVVPGRAVPAG